MTVKCPAKLNLFLSVGPKDSAGYHPVNTVLQAVSLCDELTVTPSETDQFICDSKEVPQDNTVTRAWRMAREYIELPRMRIELKKQVPSQSGLGGGSSDAAGFLRALLVLLRGKLSLNEAMDIAAAVGTDVPFFLVGGLAKATNYGEVVTPMPDSQRWPIVVVMPAATVPTASAYAALDSQPRELRPFPSDTDFGPNDFESVAPPASLEAIKTLWELGSWHAGLTGSGAATFGVFQEDYAAEGAVSAMSHHPTSKSYLCHTLTRTESLWMS